MVFFFVHFLFPELSENRSKALQEALAVKDRFLAIMSHGKKEVDYY